MTIAAGRAEPEPEHGHPGVEQFRAPAVRAEGPQRRRGRRGDPGVPRRPAACPRTIRRGARARGLFSAHKVDDTLTMQTIAETHARSGMLIDPHTAVAVAAARAELDARRRAARRWWRSPARIRRNSPMRSSAPPASARHCRRALGDLFERRERMTVLPNDLGAVTRFIRAQARRGGSSGMTMRVSTLTNGLRIATDRIDTVDTVSLGIWVDVGTRHEPAEINGVAHFLEHMAFKGTERRSARAIAEEIEAVGGHLNAYTSRESTAYYAKVLEGGRAARARYPRRHPAALDLRARGDGARAHRDPAGDRPGQRHPRRHHLRPFPGMRLSRPGDGPAGAGPAGDHPPARPRGGRRPICATITARGKWCWRRPAISSTTASPPSAEKLLSGAAGRAPGHHRAGALYRRRPARGARSRAAPPRPGLSRAGARRPRLLRRPRCCRRRLAAACPRASSRRSARSAGSSMRSIALPTAIATAGCSASMPAPAKTRRPSWCRPCARRRCGSKTGSAAVELARAKAQMKAGLLMSLESTSARCEQLAQHLLIHGTPFDPPEMVRRIEAVDDAAIGRVVARWRSGPPTLTALGPLSRLEDFERVQARLAA